MSETLTMALSPPNTATFSFDALYREAADDVHAYAWSLLGDRAGAEDVTALASERAYRRRGRFDPGRGTARAWLFAIARTAAPGRRGGWGIGDAARTALDVLRVPAGVALVALAVLVPLVLVGGGALLAGRGVRRRRREAALGA